MVEIDKTKNIAVIGLGNMGSALADALLKAGFPMTVWNRTASKSGSLVERGAKAVDSVAEAAQETDIVIVCVSDYSAITSIVHNDSVAKALEGKLLAQLGIITAEESCQFANWATSRNIEYLEGSIIGLPDEVRNAKATVVCSGPKQVFDDCSSFLSVFGTIEHVSEVTGAVYNFDKAYYAFGYAVYQGFIQGAAQAYASGFSIEAYTRIMIGRLSTITGNLNPLGAAIADRDHDGDQATIKVWANSYVQSLDLCRSLGVDDTLPDALMRNFENAVNAGYGDKELSAIFEVLLPKENGNSV